MNRKQLIVLIVILCVLGVGGWLAMKQKQTPYQGSGFRIGEKLLPDFPINDVVQISIMTATQQVTVAKPGEIWTVKERSNYPADFGRISEFLRKIWEMKVAKPVNAPASRLAMLELVAPDKGGGTKVELKDAKGKTIDTLLLGANHMKESSGESQFGGGGSWPDGRYVMVGNDSKSVALVSDPLSNVEPKPADWLSKDFFKVEKIKSISVTATNQTNNWKIFRETETGQWKLADAKPGEQLDSSKVSSANYLLSSPSFNDVITDPKPGATGLDHARQATIESFDGFTYNLKLGQAGGDDNFALRVSVSADLPTERTPGKDEKKEDKAKLDKEFKEKTDKLKEKLDKEKAFEKWTYQISKWSVDFLNKNRKDLLQEKKEEAKKPETKKEEPKKDDPFASPLEPYLPK